MRLAWSLGLGLVSVLGAASGVTPSRHASERPPPRPPATSARPPLYRNSADTLPSYVRSALSLYRRPPETGSVAEIADRWSVEGGPQTVADSIALAALWGRAGQIRLALATLPADSVAGTIRPVVLLERARMLLQPRADGPGVPGSVEGRRAEGGRSFYRACAHLDGETRRQMWLDLRGLATRREQEEWAALPADQTACTWIRRFVDERAWRMAIAPEERLQIHYDRLHHVRSRYWLRRPRLTDDLADRLGRADSLEIDDRGLVYLRMGEPEVTIAPSMDLNETWAYFRPAGARIYHFAPVSRTGFVGLGDFRLLENLAHASGLTLPSALMAAGGGRLAYLYQSRRVLDFLFDESLFGLMDRRMRAAAGRFNPGFAGVLAWERARNEEDARYAVQGHPGVPALSAAVPFAWEVLRFRQRAGDGMDAWVLASARAGDLTAGASEAAAAGAGAAVEYHLAVDLALVTAEGYRRLRVEGRPVVADPLAADDGLPLRIPLSLPPGRYPFTVAVRDLSVTGPALGNWAQDTLVVSGPIAGLPSVSDLAVAADSGGDWSRDGVTWLRVDPTHAIGTGGVAHVYLEVYGLRPGDPYEVEVRVAPETDAGRIYELGADQLAFTLRFPSEVPTSSPWFGRHHLRLELAETPPGAYVLAVRVRDRTTGVASLPAVTRIYRLRTPAVHWTEAPRRRSTIVDPR